MIKVPNNGGLDGSPHVTHPFFFLVECVGALCTLLFCIIVIIILMHGASCTRMTSNISLTIR